ncbi:MULTISPECIES: ABC transporter substrate-binding protein [Halomonadaceae]|jgi:ribose transport system substrate-binding protein|uniref:ABC transporter substrate-binding protein n=1 Tax=Vreelandella sedimenti TaxID=2729618 RepID=A0A7Z0NB81_9GAMM|nr:MULTISPECIES: ABC transporter substrate-binding protein [Halomonas]NYT75045.1 ABC transporter substrate-binding protein [Halomonas sedimenti]CAD5257368.1 ABC ribose transporter, periplasmic solute-binding protein [Halomonas sp. 59]CAD5257590.1 ABC ribose transporter, periplasmic solute-binding protein [Halomonas sp. 113]CAD5271449.1 ABC ribose transporter, periplasmic solute-binding protein [Halomonas sp. I3]CAD5291246.1 ABC ribose transporter, periplasmic solute-binding protein [Halomonas |tara:strand:+ start:4179 stop:5144 length:966 start_codon:yes stop_codon:yes gene_type:complete
MRTIKTAVKACVTTAALTSAIGLSGAAVAQEYTIGVSIPAATHGWTGGVNYHAEEAKKRLEELYPDIEITISTAGTAGEQANDLEDLVSLRNIDALVVLPFESGPLTDPVRRVKESGVFVTVVDRGLTEEGIQDLYVAGNNHELGRVSGEYIRERLDDQGDIVVLRGIPTVIDDERVQGFQEAIEGSEVNILDMQHANWNRDDGFEVMQDYLSRFDNIDAVWAQDDDIALGVIEAVRQADREDELFIVGGAGMKDIIKRVMDGDELVPVDVLYPPAMIATAMDLTVQHFVSNGPVLGEYILGSPLITQENAEQYYFPDSPF